MPPWTASLFRTERDVDRRSFLARLFGGLLGIGLGSLMATRVQLGKLPSGDYGLRVVSSDGSTVIIDGTSNMFKIAANGTLSLTQADETEGETSVTLPGLGAQATTPGHISFFSDGNANTDRRFLGAFWPAAQEDSWVAAILNGSAVRRAVTLNVAGVAWTTLDASNLVQVFLRLANHTSGSTTIYHRYYVLQESSI